jgi:hypothetical protein
MDFSGGGFRKKNKNKNGINLLKWKICKYYELNEINLNLYYSIWIK